MNKITIGNKIYDVVNPDEYKNNKNLYDPTRTAIEKDGIVFPIRRKKDTNPGYYDYGVIGFYVPPVSDDDINMYDSSNIIDFSNSKTMSEIIEKNEKLKEMERNILTTADNITTPKIKENDEPEMVALKEAIIAKHIDINKYEHRFDGKFNNDIRILKDDNTITLFKLKKFANALDLKCTLTIEDKSSDVPNPMNKTISVVLNDGDGINE